MSNDEHNLFILYCLIVILGTLVEFSISAYKNDLGVKYGQLVLYLKPYNKEDKDIADNDSENEYVEL